MARKTLSVYTTSTTEEQSLATCHRPNNYVNYFSYFSFYLVISSDFSLFYCAPVALAAAA